MVREQIVRVRRLVTLHLVLLAFLTATLVAADSQSVFLPLLVLVVGTSSLLFVDWLEWFSLHHTFAYLGMLVGTIVALADYFGSAGSDSGRQLYSIAGLLVYPEIVIMLQRKNMRLFEQMAIFLLLEIIVAALLNDNVLFGFLLAPIVLLWVSTLLLLTRYAALVQLAPDLDRPTPRLAEVLMEAWRKANKNRHAGPQKMLDIVQPNEPSRARVRQWTLLGQAAPIGIVSLVFAGLYFYLLPRASVDMQAYSNTPRTGFSESLTLGAMGKMLQDPTLVMRLSLSDAMTGRPYRLEEPPYIRGIVVSRYYRQNRFATFESRDQMVMAPTDRFDQLDSISVSGEGLTGDRVNAKFDIVSSDGSVLPCIAPMIDQEDSRNSINVLPFEWRTINGRSDVLPANRKHSYTLLTTSFRNGRELPVLPDSRRLFNKPTRNTSEALLASLAILRQERGAYSTEWIEVLRDRILSMYPHATSPIALARAAEAYFSVSGEFDYSLALPMRPDADLDPIEDFVVNQKRGHCQYFAAALTMLLRYERIPTRIVLGYHPLEYNEIGDYFTVRRRDAHAWVEAYFTPAQLREAGLYTADLGDTGGWLRLDPTPAGPGSNAGDQLRPQADQGIDFANRFWSEWVLNSRQRPEDNALYAPLQESTRETYTNMMENVKEWLKRGRQSRFLGGAIDGENWFSWPVALLIMFAGGLSVLIWKFIRWLPRWAPQLAKKLGLGHGMDDVRQHFYRQCLRLLHRAGFVRQSSQTPAEYTQAVGETLSQRQQWMDAPQTLDALTAAYYRLRFGGRKSLTNAELQRVATSLENLERHLK